MAPERDLCCHSKLNIVFVSRTLLLQEISNNTNIKFIVPSVTEIFFFFAFIKMAVKDERKHIHKAIYISIQSQSRLASLS